MIEKVRPVEDAELLSQLVALWRASVEATHDFLTSKDIERIAEYVPQAITSVPIFAIYRDEEGTSLGFIGIEGETIEMLFIDPDARGKGIGSKLLHYGVEEHGATKLDVNEQNDQAVGFYFHLGFEVVGRSEADSMGEPFPILHLSLPQ